MAFRRRWCVVVCVMGMALAALGAGLPSGATPEAFEKDALSVRKLVVSGAPSAVSEVVARDQYGAAAVAALGKEVNSVSPDVQLQVSIMFVQLGTLSCEPAYREMLKSPNEAVRYWGAKGLSEIMYSEMNVAAAGGAKTAPAGVIKSLADAAAAAPNDKSVVVKREIVNALAQAGDVKALIDALNRLATALPAGMTDHATLDAVAHAMQGTPLVAAMEKSPTPLAMLGRGNADAVKVAVVWAKLLRGQLAAADEEATKGGTALPSGLVVGVNGVIEGAAKVINAGKGTAIELKPLSSKNAPGVQETLDRIDDLLKKAGP